VSIGIDRHSWWITYLLPALFCQLDTMIWYHLVDVAILVSFALRMANHNNHLQPVSHPLVDTASRSVRTRGLPILMWF
jgi:hypothetical protein